MPLTANILVLKNCPIFRLRTKTSNGFEKTRFLLEAMKLFWTRFRLRSGTVEKEYSASDGRFFTYRARFVQKSGKRKSLVELRLCRSDYIAFPVTKPDSYSDIRTVPVKFSSDVIEIDGVQYRRTKLDKKSLNALLLLSKEPFEKANVG